jgi:hypothetical protein
MSLVETQYTPTPRPPTEFKRSYKHPKTSSRFVRDRHYNPDSGPPKVKDIVSFTHFNTKYLLTNGYIDSLNEYKPRENAKGEIITDPVTYNIRIKDSSQEYKYVPIENIKAPIQGGRRKTRQNRNKNRKSQRK